MAEFQIGDIVVWSFKGASDEIYGIQKSLGAGPFRIIASASSERPQYHVVNADGSPLLDDEVADGPLRRRYYIVADYEIRKDVFLTAVTKAAGLSTPNRSDKENELET